jgi:hypothetical protein
MRNPVLLCSLRLSLVGLLLTAGESIAIAAPDADCPPGGHRSAFQASVGIAYRELVHIPIYGALYEIGYGGRGPYASGYFTVDWLSARTEFGLLVHSAHVGGVGFWHLDRFRYGVGGRFGFYSVQRITEAGSIDFYSLTVRLPVQIDVYDLGDGQLTFLSLEGELGTNDLLSATAGIGMRL